MQTTYAFPTDRQLRERAKRLHQPWQRGTAFRGPRDYYQRSTVADWRGIGRDVPDETISTGRWHTFGEYAPRDLDGTHGSPEQVEQMLAGEYGKQRVQNARDLERRPGWDVCFSAPKSVSLIYATADRETRERIDRDLETAAVRVMARIVAPEVTTRLGHAGAERHEVSFATHTYVQHLSRRNDSQIHVHCVTPNLGWARDGGLRTIESKWLYESQRAGSMAFHAEFLERLRAHGYEFRVDDEGTVRARGVDERLEDLFSKRAEEIDATTRGKYGKSRDESAPWERDRATVESRDRHDLTYREDWRSQAVAAGLAEQWERAVAEHDAARERAHEQQREQDRERDEQRERALNRAADQAVHDLLHGTQRLHATNREEPGNALIPKHHLVAEVAARARATGGGIDEVLRAVQRADDRGALVTLEQRDENRSSLRDHWSTADMIERERGLLDHFREMATRTHTGHGVEVPDRALQGLTAEQRDALRAITADRQVALIEGRPGVGKTQLLRSARETWEAAGWRVVGESHAGVASHEMFARAGIPSRTIALAETRPRELDSRTVLVVDEFQTASSLQFSQLIDDVRRSGSKLVLVGDPGRAPDRDHDRDADAAGQHGPVGPGAPARQLAQAARELAPEATSGMRKIQRQQDPELRRIAELAATGCGDQALREADRRGWLSVTSTSEEMRQQAATFIADARREGASALVVTGSRQEQAAVNAAARAELRARNLLGADDMTYQLTRNRELPLAPGERVAAMRNDYEVGVRTGQRGEVVAISRDTGALLLRLDPGVQRADRDGQPIREHPTSFHDSVREHRITDPTREVVLDRAAVEQLIRGRELLGHDYARTSARAQSATVDRAVVAVHHESKALSRQFGAVALTRSRDELRILISAQGLERDERDPTAERAHWPRERPEQTDPAQQRLFVDPDVRKQALEEAGARMSRDAPGETTLSYPDATERARAAREREQAHREGRESTREPVGAHAPTRDDRSSSTGREDPRDPDDTRALMRGEDEETRR